MNRLEKFYLKKRYITNKAHRLRRIDEDVEFFFPSRIKNDWV